MTGSPCPVWGRVGTERQAVEPGPLFQTHASQSFLAQAPGTQSGPAGSALGSSWERRTVSPAHRKSKVQSLTKSDF